MNKHPVSDFQETDVDQVPFEWELVSLEEICTVHKQIFNPNGEQVVPYVGLEHLEPGNPKLLSWGTSSEVRSAKTFFYPNQVLYGKLRPYLDKAALATFEGVCSTDIMVFNVTDKATPDYLVNLLHTGNFLKYASSTMVGVNHPRTNWASLKEFKVSLPPLPEQRRIAAVLTAIQEAIAAQDDVITAARAFKRSLMQRLFTYGPGREPAETKETEIGKIPAHWEVVCLGDLVDVRGGKRLPKGSLYSENITNHPYIRVVDFADFSVDRSDLKYISEETYKQISRYIITSDDVYISNAGTIGLVGTIPQELSGGNLTENAARLIIKEKRKLDKFYLSQWLGFDFGQAQIQVRTTKTSQPKLALMRIQQIPLALPNISEQEKIANALLTVDAKIAAEEDRQASLQAFFQSTLHHLMTGQIRLLHDKGLPL